METCPGIYPGIGLVLHSSKIITLTIVKVK